MSPSGQIQGANSTSRRIGRLRGLDLSGPHAPQVVDGHLVTSIRLARPIRRPNSCSPSAGRVSRPVWLTPGHAASPQSFDLGPGRLTPHPRFAKSCYWDPNTRFLAIVVLTRISAEMKMLRVDNTAPRVTPARHPSCSLDLPRDIPRGRTKAPRGRRLVLSRLEIARDAATVLSVLSAWASSVSVQTWIIGGPSRCGLPARERGIRGQPAHAVRWPSKPSGPNG
jgi:hypothetical protein